MNVSPESATRLDFAVDDLRNGLSRLVTASQDEWRLGDREVAARIEEATIAIREQVNVLRALQELGRKAALRAELGL